LTGERLSFAGGTALRYAPDVVFRVISGEALVVELKSGLYFGLDPVGTRAWELVGERGTFGGILEAMLSEFDVDEERLRGALEKLVAELVESRLIRIGDAPGS
jgi:hypothetical protein